MTIVETDFDIATAGLASVQCIIQDWLVGLKGRGSETHRGRATMGEDGRRGYTRVGVQPTPPGGSMRGQRQELIVCLLLKKQCNKIVKYCQ